MRATVTHAGRFPTSIGDARSRLGRFFGEEIWKVRIRDLGRKRAALYRLSRILYTTYQGFRENRITFRAAALTYYSVLSAVPCLAFAFSVLKGFNVYETFMEQRVRPYLVKTFGDNPALMTALDKVLEFVEKTNASGLVTTGLLVLVYTSVSLLASAEQSLNDIWGAKSRRPFLRQLTDYVTLLVTTPLLILVAATFAAGAQSSSLVLFLRESLHLGGVMDFLMRFASLVITAIAMIGFLLILPNVRVRVASAVIGGIASAILWQVVLLLHVKIQVGVAAYNAVYSALAALPVFMVWLYFSWIIMLTGAQLAASHQNEQTVRQRVRARHADQSVKETLAVVASALVARDLLDGGPRRGAVALAELLEVPAPTMEEILDALVRAGILVRVVCGREIGYLPGRDLDAVRRRDIESALRRDPDSAAITAVVERQLGQDLQRVLRARDDEEQRSPHNLTLRELAALVDRQAPAVREQDERVSEAPVAVTIQDAKQPELPT
jgi:membrane protein